jgi:hypothetical protein
MVIGISGRLGSGKDTVGEIIQYLTGVDADGKFSKGLNWSYSSNFEIKKFAGKLKIIGSMLSGVPVEYFEDQDFKKLPMGLEWEMTYREFLQKLGTEAMRDGLHTNVWVNALFADYKVDIKEITNKSYSKKEDKWVHQWGGKEILSDNQNFSFKKYNYPNWIITDMRFPNEIAAVELREGITIRVNRDNGTREIDTNPHPSETALDDAKFDYVIENDGTLDELVEKVRAILIREKIIL